MLCSSTQHFYSTLLPRGKEEKHAMCLGGKKVCAACRQGADLFVP
jgi:hypothetical protein